MYNKYHKTVHSGNDMNICELKNKKSQGTTPQLNSAVEKRIDDDFLVNLPKPWNKYPAYLRYVFLPDDSPV